MFYHDENILFDTPEDIFNSLNRENIERVDTVFLSHYHFDHTLGLRILQSLKLQDKPVRENSGEPTRLVLSQATYDRFIAPNDSFEHLTKWAELTIINDGDTLHIGDTDVTCIGAPMEPDGDKEMYNYLLEKNGDSILLSQDETKFLDLDRIPTTDVWIHETGMFEHTPAGQRTMSKPIWEDQIQNETTFEETLEHVSEVNPDQAVLTEIEEIYQRSHDDLNDLAAKHDTITFAHDGMNVTV